MSEILYEKNDHIAFISLNRPQALNAINRSLANQLIKAWIDFRDDKDVWVAILSGQGESFCTGADIKEMDIGKWEFRQSLLFGDEPIGPSEYNVWKPIIAATHGHVNGGGLWLALQSDIRIAATNSLFGAGETRVNLPVLIAPFLSDYMPRCIAAEILLTADPMDAQRAYEIGLVNKIVPQDQLMNEATKVAQKICKRGPLSVWATKELSIRSRYKDYDAILSLIAHIAPPIWNSEDSAEGKRAFIEKKTPIWKLR